MKVQVPLVASVVLALLFVAQALMTPLSSDPEGGEGAAGPDGPGGDDVDGPLTQAMHFGLDAPGAMRLQGDGAQPEYGTIWVGPWTLRYGWASVERTLIDLEEAGIQPAVHFYYWGNDISAKCLRDGCSTGSGHKDADAWRRLAEGLAQRLAAHGGEAPMIIMETEFNKGNVATYEPLDEALAGMADLFHAEVPGAQVVLGLGNWYPPAWSTWDRAAAASDAIGLQAMRASTRHGLDGLDVLADTLDGARIASDLFGKPVVVHDVAISSYPGDEGVEPQANAVQNLMGGLDDLRDAGVVAIIYRSLRDTPNADTNEYFGLAERNWGLAHGDGSLKPAGTAWMSAVQQERARVVQPAVPTVAVA